MADRPGDESEQRGLVESAISTVTRGNSTAFGFSITITGSFGVVQTVVGSPTVVQVLLFAVAALLLLVLVPFIVAGAFLVAAYNLELFGGRFHTDGAFAGAWGACPVLTAYGAQAERLAVPALLAAAQAGQDAAPGRSVAVQLYGQEAKAWARMGNHRHVVRAGEPVRITHVLDAVEPRVRPDGRPHVTPLVAVWLDGALHFCTGPGEQKAVNLAGNPHVVVTTGCNQWDRGLDVMAEGEARRVTDRATLERLAAVWATKWDGSWRYEVADEGFRHGAGLALVFAVEPAKVLAFGKGPFSHTRHLPAGR